MVKIFEMKRYLIFWQEACRFTLNARNNFVREIFPQAKVLRSIQKLELNDVILGQFKASSEDHVDVYLNNLTPTFFAAALYIDNARWDGVPFLIKAGIGLIQHRYDLLQYSSASKAASVHSSFLTCSHPVKPHEFPAKQQNGSSDALCFFYPSHGYIYFQKVCQILNT